MGHSESFCQRVAVKVINKAVATETFLVNRAGSSSLLKGCPLQVFASGFLSNFSGNFFLVHFRLTASDLHSC